MGRGAGAHGPEIDHACSEGAGTPTPDGSEALHPPGRVMASPSVAGKHPLAVNVLGSERRECGHWKRGPRRGRPYFASAGLTALESRVGSGSATK